MTKPARGEDADKICHGKPISLRLPEKYEALTREKAKAEGRPLTNFARWGFIQWLESTYGETAAPRRGR